VKLGVAQHTQIGGAQLDAVVGVKQMFGGRSLIDALDVLVRFATPDTP
jgi:hypothetical protein